jgi:3'-5' exoribonuclease
MRHRSSRNHRSNSAADFFESQPAWVFEAHAGFRLAAAAAHWEFQASCVNLLGRMKDVYIADLASYEEGKLFDGFFLVLAKQQRTTRTNKPYLNLMLGDKTGQVEARIWEPGDPRIAKAFDRGDTVKIRGCAARFDDRCQIKIDQLRLAQPVEVEKSDLLPATAFSVDELWSRLLSSVESLANSDLKRLLHAILADEAIAGAYREAPAARGLHHAWLGGLLEHVVSLLGMAERVAAHYPFLDRDLLLTGVILHDIGKIRELSWAIGFEYTVEGILLGHIQMGVDLVEKAIAALPDFPGRLRTLVLHMILSHHGKLEFGSPKLPMIPEALALNFIDDFDAKMQAVMSEFEKSLREGKSPDELTGKVWSLDNRQLLNTKRWLGEDGEQGIGNRE